MAEDKKSPESPEELAKALHAAQEKLSALEAEKEKLSDMQEKLKKAEAANAEMAHQIEELQSKIPTNEPRLNRINKGKAIYAEEEVEVKDKKGNVKKETQIVAYQFKVAEFILQPFGLLKSADLLKAPEKHQEQIAALLNKRSNIIREVGRKKKGGQ